jgi:hypothetical protein
MGGVFGLEITVSYAIYGTANTLYQHTSTGPLGPQATYRYLALLVPYLPLALQGPYRPCSPPVPPELESPNPCPLLSELGPSFPGWPLELGKRPSKALWYITRHPKGPRRPSWGYL